MENVAGVKFDCRIATVTMKSGAELAKVVAEKALKDAGFGVKSFESGAGATVSPAVPGRCGTSADLSRRLGGPVISVESPYGAGVTCS